MMLLRCWKTDFHMWEYVSTFPVYCTIQHRGFGFRMLLCPLVDVISYIIFLILTAVDCGNLIDPDNGQVTSETTFGQTATYSCNTGYNLVGDRTRTCQAEGSWSGSAPTCKGTLCYL